MLSTNFFLLILFLLFCGAIFSYDYLFRRVPNVFLLIAIALQLCCLLVQDSGLNGTGWLSALSGFAAGLVFFLPLYVLRAMAAGDVKFFAVLGLLSGPQALLPVFLIASGMAFLHALLLYASRMGLAPGLQLIAMRMARRAWYQRILGKRGNRVGIPYAAYLALAAALICIRSSGAVPGFT
ncbi:prepilin peptidase [Collimonas humicola]|uniref:A24 family peptidase n=1 Tax=Collimonas humicola TaxID=2825886 RepID=UPI001B8C5074|nr:A24 family peptidase [Collimonas humicola]